MHKIIEIIAAPGKDATVFLATLVECGNRLSGWASRVLRDFSGTVTVKSTLTLALSAGFGL